MALEIRFLDSVDLRLVRANIGSLPEYRDLSAG